MKFILLFYLSFSMLFISVHLQETATAREKYELAKSQFNVQYQNEEEFFRYKIFEANLLKIEQLNQGTSSNDTFGITPFAFMNEDEFAANFLNEGIAQHQISRTRVTMTDKQINPANLQITPINWKTNGKVTAVRYQGQCGSCWAFSTVGSLESTSLLRGVSGDYSEQQLVDCATFWAGYASYGCGGGVPYYAFLYVGRWGLARESEYPYSASQGVCRRTSGAFRITHLYSMLGCQSLILGLQYNPVSVGVEAVNWQLYTKGVFPAIKCGNRHDHAVLLVGVSSTEWLIKNSWGTNWGENGYIRLQIGDTCGLCSYTGFFAR